VRVTCARKDLHEGVQAAARAVSARTSLPILGHLLMNAEEGKLRIAATDLEIGMECVVEARVQEQGVLTVPARMLTEVLATLPDADVSISCDESNVVSLNCGTSDFTILGLPPEEFPMLPEVKEEVSFSIESEVLREGIRKTSFAISQDESRAILTGVLLEVNANSLKMVATDTYRLCVLDCSLIESEGSINAIVPGRAMNELSRILPEGEGTVHVTLSGSQIMFKVGDSVLISRLIDGQFPNYEKVIPGDYNKKLTIPTELFLQSVRRASIVARENSNRAILRTDNGTLVVTAESGKLGKAREEVEVVREGDDMRMAFNARYLMDVLGVIDTEAVEMELTGEVSPAVVRPQGQENYIYVLMPMQIE